MASARIPALRNLLLGRRQLLLLQQRRWAQVHDVRFVATTQPARSVAEKYREKLDRKAREEGLRDIAELKEAYRDRIQELRRKDTVSVPGLDALLADEQPPAPSSSSPAADKVQGRAGDGSARTTPPVGGAAAASTSGAGVKPLSEILDLPKARALPEKELSAVWRLRHAASPNSLCAVIPRATYLSMEATARRHPSFVLPVPRGADVGAEIHFLQWVFDSSSTSTSASRTATVLFTQLAEYKARGEWAQPHTSITHYVDAGLAGVLMAGSVVDGRGASVQDAKWLVMLLQRFYGGEGRGGERDGGEKRRLLEEFGRGDGRFSVERLLEESEKLG
ncbi:ATP11-domain-containing protein [Daldinia caldariorum]|uniref:ATP11-domain-containing protein n=1 Tax=Daldinia caldariorum TaxID=326644 RepID=UPI002007CCDE|nr:ATP11-domain-containing protein [Daldinia caldariorum]KAI1466743.1 ATP11-domain-containing protein [Daldinia caldariorum]